MAFGKGKTLTAEPFIEPATITTDEPFMRVEPEEESRRIVGEPASEEVYTPSEEERAQFASLLTCGKRSKVIEVLGHKVLIESLNVDDDLQIGLFTKEYLDSTGYATAVKLATCAAGIKTVNNRPLYQTLSSDESPGSVFRAKIEKLRSYHLAPITEIYREILNLDVEFGELAVRLGKLKG